MSEQKEQPAGESAGGTVLKNPLANTGDQEARFSPWVEKVPGILARQARLAQPLLGRSAPQL